MKLRPIKDLKLSELILWAESEGLPKFRAKQIFEWLYAHRASTFDDMTSLPKSLRDDLASHFILDGLSLSKESQSKDGTIKALLELPSGRNIEAVLIPELSEEGDATVRLTLCVSSQVGCAMACTFCATGQMGFKENLSLGQIVDQVRLMNDRCNVEWGRDITNIVFMGMGEPLLNYDNVMMAIEILRREDVMHFSPRRITVSTVGLSKSIRRIADEDKKFRLAVSLHSAINEKRSEIMPVNRSEKTDLQSLSDSIVYYTKTTGLKVTYEYCVLRDVNDSEEDAVALANIARRSPSKINLIVYNPVKGLEFEPSSDEKLNAFVSSLVAKDVRVTVRRSRGQDIDAACGQLATITD